MLHRIYSSSIITVKLQNHMHQFLARLNLRKEQNTDDYQFGRIIRRTSDLICSRHRLLQIQVMKYELIILL